MKFVLVHINDDSGQAGRLGAAIDLVRALGGHLVCLQVARIGAFTATDLTGSHVMVSEMLASAEGREDENRLRIEDMLRLAGISWEWQPGGVDPVREIASRARLADVIVLSRTVQAPGLGAPLPIVADVAVSARAPVLAVPPEMAGFDARGSALVAWNGSPEAAIALRFSLPLLGAASAVRLVVVEEEAQDYPASAALRYLEAHRIGATLETVPRGYGSVADALIGAADSWAPAYVVMGAYGHSRVREFLLGGVTRDMLMRSPVPLLMAH